MANNVTFQDTDLSTPPNATVVETKDVGGGIQRQVMQIGVAPTGTVSTVAATASSVTLLAANTVRRGATMVNDSTSILYLSLSATASSTNFTCEMAGSNAQGAAYYEVPFWYSGIVTGAWATATGNARVTEVT